jgi:hypothetical protein
MWNPFKRAAPKVPKPQARGVSKEQSWYQPAQAARSKVPSSNATHPLPLVEVSEGNLDSDWAMWEDSVSFQDSQMPPLDDPRLSVRTKEKLDGPDLVDPFGTVNKRSR